MQKQEALHAERGRGCLLAGGEGGLLSQKTGVSECSQPSPLGLPTPPPPPARLAAHQNSPPPPQLPAASCWGGRPPRDARWGRLDYLTPKSYTGSRCLRAGEKSLHGRISNHDQVRTKAEPCCWIRAGRASRTQCSDLPPPPPGLIPPVAPAAPLHPPGVQQPWPPRASPPPPRDRSAVAPGAKPFSQVVVMVPKSCSGPQLPPWLSSPTEQRSASAARTGRAGPQGHDRATLRPSCRAPPPTRGPRLVPGSRTAAPGAFHVLGK